MGQHRKTINKYIHENILGLCSGADWFILTEPCPNCGEKDDWHDDVPDYCSDDSPRKLLNEAVAKVSREAATEILEDRRPLGQHWLLEATAEQIARACVEAWNASGPSSEAKPQTATRETENEPRGEVEKINLNPEMRKL